MSTSIPGAVRATASRTAPRRVHVLTAEDAGPPGRPCVPGELVWTDDLCDDRPCWCEWGWNGAASCGVTTVASVRRLPATSRSEVRRALVDCMGAHGCPPLTAAARVDRLLALAAELPEGTLLRLEQGRPVPFPPGSRMQGRGTVISPAPGSRR